MLSRPRRNRKNTSIRSLVRETSLTPSDLIAPLFVIEGKNKEVAIDSMPGISRYSLDLIVKKAKHLYS